ncbi:hypothetical protein F383_25894 [Gossypium arboreum]|uniref:Uncharacterized protein n=1 Tax=Gossypium arboreum TaxID=29729 RepID=A0A0B0P857_GOSAR|nr:hypothetical protein F383_25894 [Gossypium arboreum]
MNYQGFKPSKPCAGDFDRALCLAGLVLVNKYQTFSLVGLVPVGDSGLCLADFGCKFRARGSLLKSSPLSSTFGTFKKSVFNFLACIC